MRRGSWRERAIRWHCVAADSDMWKALRGAAGLHWMQTAAFDLAARDGGDARFLDHAFLHRAEEAHGEQHEMQRIFMHRFILMAFADFVDQFMNGIHDRIECVFIARQDHQRPLGR